MTAKAGHKQATLHWKAPQTNGKPIKGYLVQAFRAGVLKASHTSKGKKTSFLFTGLAPRSLYGFRVVAVNARGKSPASLPSKGVRIK